MNWCIAIAVFWSLLSTSRVGATANEKNVDAIAVKCAKCDPIKPGTKRKAILLIHGISSSSDIWTSEIATLSTLSDFDVYVVDFATSIIGRDGTSAHDIAIILGQKISEHPALKDAHLTVVAHSLGGIVALNLLSERLSTGQISHIVLLGSPVRGSPYANLPYPATTVLSSQAKGLLPDGDDLTRLSLKLWKLAKSPKAVRMPKLLSIGGSRDTVVPPDRAYLSLPGETAATNLIVDAGHTDLHALTANPTLRRMVLNFIEDRFDALDFEPNEPPIKFARVTLCLKETISLFANISGEVYVKTYYSPTTESLQNGGFFLLEEEGSRTYFRESKSISSSWTTESCPTVKTCDKKTGQCVTKKWPCTRTPVSETSYQEIKEDAPRLWVNRAPTFALWLGSMSRSEVLNGLRNEGIQFRQQSFVIEEMKREKDNDYIIKAFSDQRIIHRISPEDFISVLFRPTALKAYKTDPDVYLYAALGSLPNVKKTSARCFVVSDVLPGEYSLDIIDSLVATEKALGFHNVYLSGGTGYSAFGYHFFGSNDTRKSRDIRIDEPYPYIEW